MELFTPLTGFYKAIGDDVRISTTHISLYMALLHQWNLNGGNNPVPIVRSVIMRTAKINARHTYYKCINDLQDFGYITYKPANNAHVVSKIFLKELGK